MADPADTAMDTDMEGWFRGHGLLCDDQVAASFDEWGVECVEHLKLVPRKSFLALFDGGKFVVREIAVSVRLVPRLARAFLMRPRPAIGSHPPRPTADQKLAFDELAATPVRLTRCIVPRPAVGSAARAATAKKEEGGRGAKRRRSAPAGPAPPARRGRAGAREAALADDPLLDGVIRLWRKNGHQTNLLRLNVAHALRGGCTVANIARQVRTRAFGPWDGLGSRDARYRAILESVIRIRDAMKDEKLDELHAQSRNQGWLMSKSVVLGARGRKPGTKIKKEKSDEPEVAEPEAEAVHPEPSEEV